MAQRERKEGCVELELSHFSRALALPLSTFSVAFQPTVSLESEKKPRYVRKGHEE